MFSIPAVFIICSRRFKPEERNSKHPSTWLRRIHDHLLQICENSGLKGLTYKAGPWLENCCNPRCTWDQPAVFPVMSYPKKEYEMECNLCLITLDVDLLLNPEVLYHIVTMEVLLLSIILYPHTMFLIMHHFSLSCSTGSPPAIKLPLTLLSSPHGKRQLCPLQLTIHHQLCREIRA